MLKLWFACTSDRVSHGVPDWSRHCQSGTIDILDPNSLRPTESTSPILSLRYFASHCIDSGLFFGIVWLVIGGNRFRFDFVIVVKRYENDPRVTDVTCRQLVAVEESRSKCRARELYIENTLRLNVVLAFNHRIVKGVCYYFLFLLLQCLLMVLIFFFWVRLIHYFGMLFALM